MLDLNMPLTALLVKHTLYYSHGNVCPKSPVSSPDGPEDLRVPTHPQVVVAAPDRHLWDVPPGDRVVLGEGKGLSAAVHGLEDSVRVVLLLLRDLLDEERVVIEAGADCGMGGGKIMNSSSQDDPASLRVSVGLTHVVLQQVGDRS